MNDKRNLLDRILNRNVQLSEATPNAALDPTTSDSSAAQTNVAENKVGDKTENAGSSITPKKTNTIGSTGTEVYSGYPSEEYLRELSGSKRAKVFDEMKRSDTQVAMVLKAIKYPILAGNWEVDPGSAEDEDPSDEQKQDAAFISHVLFNDLDKPWKKKLAEILTFAEQGHSVFEVTNKVVFDHPEFGTYNGIASLGFRAQKTIERWNVNKDTGDLVSITQQSFGDLNRYVDIPADFLLVFNLNQEGSNFEGISLLRPCYGSWMRKNLYLKLNAIGIEKFAVPTPVASVPGGQPKPEDIENLKEVLASYTSHEENYIVLPSGYTVTFNTNAYDPQKVEGSVDREDVRIAKAFLATFLELGMSGGGGSFAMSNDLSDFLLSGLDYVASEVTSVINEKLIPNLIKMNFGAREFYPQLKVNGITDKAGVELSQILKNLADSQWLKPEDNDEASLRRRLGLPKSNGVGVREVKPLGALGIDPNAAPPANQLAEGRPLTLSERVLLSEYRRGRRG